jgi:phosphoribosylformimino-5-aminoimidazole carboxamide ribotide isomerase
VFSLDLRLGRPVLHAEMQDARGAGPDALSLAEQATATGVVTILLLDLGRVGTGCGVDLGLLETLRRRFPRTRLLAGGGVLTRLDLERMRDAGCDGALVASAIHTGRVTPADLAALSQSRPRPNQSGASASW